MNTPSLSTDWTDDFEDLLLARRSSAGWTIDGVLPHGLVVLGGFPKLSQKSTFALALAARIAGLGATLPGEIGEARAVAGRVLYWSAEADAGDLRDIYERRLAGAGPLRTGELGGLLVARDPYAFRLDDPACADRLAAWYDVRRPSLVIIDPLRAFHSLAEKDEVGTEHLLRRHQRWARLGHATLLVVHHVRKPPPIEGERRPPAMLTPDDLRGSGALWALADGAIMLTPVGPDKVIPGMQAIHVGAWYKRGKATNWTWRVPG